MTTFIGSDTRNSSSAADVANTDAIYGVSRVIRLYSTGSLTAPAVTDRKQVGSFKSLTGVTKAKLDAYSFVFYQHEIDSKVKKGQITLAKWKSDMSTLQKLGSSRLSVCLTADCFVNPSKNPDDYIIPGITHYGVDFDGISSDTGYHDYSQALTKVKAWATLHSFTIGVPEFGANRAANDPDGEGRSEWLRTWVRQFQLANFEYVCFWEYSGQSGSLFDSAVETATVSTAIQLGP